MTACFDVKVPMPFEQRTVVLTQAEHIDLKHQRNYWESQHKRSQHKCASLQQALDAAEATIRDLKQRLYGKKSEKKTCQSDSVSSSDTRGSGSTSRSRGQQRGSQGHGRTPRPSLPLIPEVYDLTESDQHCPCCGKSYQALAGSEDSEIIEIEVKAYTRQIKRKKYAQRCHCVEVTGLITAPVAPRLIPKSGIGVSVWTEVLVNKFLFARAMHNLCTEYALRGLPLAPGTLTGGLKKIVPLLLPLLARLREKQLTESLFHSDETGWKVYEAPEGKIGYRWWLWVMQSKSVVYYLLVPSRSGDVPIEHFSGLDKHLDQVIVVCDRYKAYQRLARENPVILLAFCWAHVRRDFLDAACSWPALNDWMLAWVEQIGHLYHLNSQRLAVWDASCVPEEQTPEFQIRQQALEQAVQQMAEQRDQLLNITELHPAQRDVLNSLANHWPGLTVFVKHPVVPMDNNTAERRMRNPGMGRKNYYGSGSQWSAGLAATLFSLFQTILLWGLNPHHWLYDYLQTCANQGGQVPVDLDRFIPWTMEEHRREALKKPLSSRATDPPE